MEPSQPATRKVYIRTYGCQMNVYDSGKMLALLEKDGYEATDDVEQADLVLVNTCSVRQKPERKLESFIGEMRRYKAHHGAIVGVTGCTAQVDGAHMFTRYPWLDLVVGPDALARIPQLVREAAGRRVLDTHFLEVADYPFVAEVDPDAGRQVTGLVTIQKGCDNRCTYCIVPTARGPEVSRPSAAILAEVRELAARGVHDLTLIGQNVNCYGRKTPGELDFAGLLRAVHAIDGVWRLRFTTSHPRDLDDGTIQCWRDLPRLASHLHLPVQSGSDRMLRRMNRGYTRAHFLERVRAVQAARPGIAMHSDFIVGFPGETDDDFQASLSLMEEVPLHGSFSFIYSPRSGTPGERLHAREGIDPQVAGRRLLKLQALQRRLSTQANEALEGRELEVLVEGFARQDPGELRGRSSCFRTVNFAGPLDLVGRLVRVRITQGLINSLRGELVR